MREHTDFINLSFAVNFLLQSSCQNRITINHFTSSRLWGSWSRCTTSHRKQFFRCCYPGTGSCLGAITSGKLHLSCIQIFLSYPFIQTFVNWRKVPLVADVGNIYSFLLTIHIMNIKLSLSIVFLYANYLGQWPIVCLVHSHGKSTTFRQGGLKWELD